MQHLPILELVFSHKESTLIPIQEKSDSIDLKFSGLWIKLNLLVTIEQLSPALWAFETSGTRSEDVVGSQPTKLIR